MDAKISHMAYHSFVKHLYFNAHYSDILRSKLTEFGI